MRYSFLLFFFLSSSVYSTISSSNTNKNREAELGINHKKNDELKRGDKSASLTFFLPYQRNYFVFGDPNAKFQLSFKWRITNSKQLFFGYTQLSFWSIFNESGPFKEIAFSPEVFYRFDLDFLNFRTIDIGFFQHISNGKDGLDSRSFDQSYIRFISKKKFKDGFSFIVENKFNLTYNIEDTNKNIDDFLGFYQLTLRLKNIFKFAFDDEELFLRYRPGKEIFSFSEREYGYLNLGFSFRFQNSKILPTFYIDYFSGFTETILDYRKKDKRLRGGITTRW